MPKDKNKQLDNLSKSIQNNTTAVNKNTSANSVSPLLDGMEGDATAVVDKKSTGNKKSLSLFENMSSGISNILDRVKKLSTGQKVIIDDEKMNDSKKNAENKKKAKVVERRDNILIEGLANLKNTGKERLTSAGKSAMNGFLIFLGIGGLIPLLPALMPL